MVTSSSLAFVACLIVLALPAQVQSTPNVQLRWNANSTASLFVNNALWFMTDDVYFTCNGTIWSVVSGTLNLTSTTTQSGSDSFGSYNQTIQIWSTATGGPNGNFLTSYKFYYSLTAQPAAPVDVNNIRAVLFTQTYLQACTGTKVSDPNGLSAGFPNFNPWAATTVIGGFQWEAVFIANAVMTYTTKLNVARLESSGPIAFMDQAGNVTAVLSSASNFMAHSCVDGQKTTYHTLQCGINGGSTSIPNQFTMDTILYFDDIGIAPTVVAWGSVLLGKYNKTRTAMYSGADVFVYKLAYTTDAGAFYYYNTEVGVNYEQTMVDVVNANKLEGLPYAAYEFDSWFYDKGVTGGVVNYVASPQIFPDGLAAVWQGMGKPPLMTHFRFFDSSTVYATQNNGSYLFVSDSGYALPLEERFWVDFFTNNTKWGMSMFEHDWLNNIWGSLNAIKQNVTLGRDWMMQMGAAATTVGIHIELCSPYPRHILQTLEMGTSVLHARASTDYKPGTSQWQIGEPSLLMYALGIAPFKDGQWSTSVQPQNPYNLSEPASALELAVSTLSTGPVMVGDAMGYTNIPLVMRSCRQDGVLLKPDHPAWPIDARFLYKTFKGVNVNGPSADLWSTSTTIGNASHYVVLAVTRYAMGLKDLHADSTQSYVVSYYQNFVSSLEGSTPTLASLTSANTFTTFTSPSSANFSLYYVSPVYANQIVVLGEKDKWTAMSAQRISSLVHTTTSTTLGLIGAPQESVVFRWTVADPLASSNLTSPLLAPALSYTVLSISCTIGTDGTAKIQLNNNGTSACSSNVVSSSSSSTGLGGSSSYSSTSSSSSSSSSASAGIIVSVPLLFALVLIVVLSNL